MTERILTHQISDPLQLFTQHNASIATTGNAIILNESHLQRKQLNKTLPDVAHSSPRTAVVVVIVVVGGGTSTIVIIVVVVLFCSRCRCYCCCCCWLRHCRLHASRRSM